MLEFFRRTTVQSGRVLAVLVLDASGKSGQVILRYMCVIADRSSDHSSIADDNIKACSLWSDERSNNRTDKY